MPTLYLFTVRSVNDSLCGIFFIRTMPNLMYLHREWPSQRISLITSLSRTMHIMVILILGCALQWWFSLILLMAMKFTLDMTTFICQATNKRNNHSSIIMMVFSHSFKLFLFSFSFSPFSGIAKFGKKYSNTNLVITFVTTLWLCVFEKKWWVYVKSAGSQSQIVM